MDDEAFKQNLRHDLTEFLILCMLEKMQNKVAEPMCVGVRVAEMHDQGADQMVLTWTKKE